VATLRRMEAVGLVRGTEGNVSARAGELVAVSPTSLPYDTLRPEDVPLVTAQGRLVEGREPSVELPMHLAVLSARPSTRTRRRRPPGRACRSPKVRPGPPSSARRSWPSPATVTRS
jgi:hypothetical protein